MTIPLWSSGTPDHYPSGRPRRRSQDWTGHRAGNRRGNKSRIPVKPVYRMVTICQVLGFDDAALYAADGRRVGQNPHTPPIRLLTCLRKIRGPSDDGAGG